MNYSFSEGKDHVLGLLLLIYDVIPSAEWVFITLGMSIAAQIDINIQGEAISSETTFPFSGDLILQPLLGMTHKSTVPTLVLNHTAAYLPSWTEHLRHAKQLNSGGHSELERSSSLCPSSQRQKDGPCRLCYLGVYLLVQYT